ncbi:MAG: hypothetical protein M3Z01_02800 [Thermoproteota archaeon]|nr:hypothetical protein [Thermoproteota archaeon]
MFQVIINHSGLSLGEVEAINNLFLDYAIYENTTDNDFEYASILEVEFMKDKKIAFFDFIPIEKWAYLIEIIKNIKRRRGKKGLKLKIIITDVNKFSNNNDDDDEPIIFNKTIFLLNHKNDLDFNKGLERIEITIENMVEMYEFRKLQEEQWIKNNKSTKDKIQNKIEDNKGDLIIFIFNEIARKWIRSIDRSHIYE